MLRRGALFLLVIAGVCSSCTDLSTNATDAAFNDIAWVEDLFRQKALSALPLTEEERSWITNRAPSSSSSKLLKTHRYTKAWKLPTGSKARVFLEYEGYQAPRFTLENLTAEKIPAKQ